MSRKSPRARADTRTEGQKVLSEEYAGVRKAASTATIASAVAGAVGAGAVGALVGAAIPGWRKNQQVIPHLDKLAAQITDTKSKVRASRAKVVAQRRKDKGE